MTIPIGSTLVHRYFRAPRDVNPGEPHETLEDAVTDALGQWAQLPGDFPVFPPVVDEMWVMAEQATGRHHHVLHQRSTIAPGLTEGDRARTGADRRAVADALGKAAAPGDHVPQTVRT